MIVVADYTNITMNVIEGHKYKAWKIRGTSLIMVSNENGDNVIMYEHDFTEID